jgi:molybdenum cofactor biosynthesis protein B
VSDTRGPDDDPGGDRAAGRIAAEGHEVTARAWVRDEPARIRAAVRAALRNPELDLVVLTGGTGVSPRDRTPEAVAPMLQKSLPGFGELFRLRSLDQVGTAAWLSRAGAGVVSGRLVVYLPGSPAAVDLGLREVLLPELPHLLRMLGRIPSGA